MIKKTLCKIIIISFVLCTILLNGCKLFFNNNPESNNVSVEIEKTDNEEHVFAIPIQLNPLIVEHGAIPSNFFESSSSDKSSADGSLSSRSTTIVPDITTINSLSITATRKRDGNGTEIPTENQTVSAGNIITATANTSPQTFYLKINKTGTWLIEVSFVMSGTSYSGSKTILLTADQIYKEGVIIYAYADDFDSISIGSTGNVRLVTEYEENLTSGTPSLAPKSASMKLKRRHFSTGRDDNTSYTINGIINSTARTVSFTGIIPSGLYFSEIAFFSDSEQKVPLYVCSETVIVSDDKTTDTWVISSSYFENSTGDLLKYSQSGPLQEKNGEAKFIITSKLVEPFVQKYEGLEYYVGGDNASDLNSGSKLFPFATVQKAVDTIIGTVSEPGVNDNHSVYTILLKSDIKENQNTASYGSDRKYSYVNMTGLTSTPSNTQIKITSDSEALTEYNNSSSTPKETGHGFSIDANRDANHTGSVIFVENANLTLEKVTIRGGYNANITSPANNNITAGGIVLFTENSELILNQGACIEDNIFYGTNTGAGGISIYGFNSSLVMNGGEIRNNRCISNTVGVGGVWVNGTNSGAFFTMLGGKIYGNTGCVAGGIYVNYNATFTMKGGVIGIPSSEVSKPADANHWGNKSVNGGGAIYVNARGKTYTNYPSCAKINLEGGEICYNYSDKNGGAIYCGSSESYDNPEKAIININGTNILYNAAGLTRDDGSGGAIYAQCTVINMYKGFVQGNQAGGRGGAFCVENTQTSGSGSDNDNRLYIYGGRITQNLCKNIDSESTDGLKARGGGIYLGTNAKCYVKGGIIEQNKTYTTNSSSSAVSYGGGIYTETIFDQTFSTYTPTTSAKFAPHLYINGGVINANTCEAPAAAAQKRGSAIFSDCTLYTVNRKSVVSANNDIEQASMVYVGGTTTTTTIEDSPSFATSGKIIGNIYVCAHEVTQAEYNAVMGMNLSNFQGADNLPESGENQEYRPVEKVNWFDAIVYCNRLSLMEGLEPYYTCETVSDWNSLTYVPPSDTAPPPPYWEEFQNIDSISTTNGNGYRLPTCMEWEYAARDGASLHSNMYVGTSGNDPGNVAWYNVNSGNKTHEVMKKNPNDLGLYDMNGNVAEWIYDLAKESLNPSIYRSIMGGSYASYAEAPNYVLQINNGINISAGQTSNSNGLRVFRNAPSSLPSQKYIVTFDTTTNWPNNPHKIFMQEVSSGGHATAPSDPTPTASGEEKHGNFLGWYTKPKPQQNPASGGSDPVDSSFDFENTAITENLTLYAVWDFVYVAGTTFDGSETLCKEVTNKESVVFIKDRTLPIGNLWACDHEVTQGEYEMYMGYGNAPSNGNGFGGIGVSRPAYNVSWYDAVMYCNLRSEAEGLTPVYYLAGADGNEVANGRKVSEWYQVANDKVFFNDNKYYFYTANDSDTGSACSKLDYKGDGDTDGGIRFDQNANGYRLPTEAEWEYLAREGSLSETQFLYSGSNDVDEVAWTITIAFDVGPDSPDYGTHIVKTKACNALGLYDMSGNVAEWCWDWGGTIDASTLATGLTSSDNRVLRSGTWRNMASNAYIGGSGSKTPCYMHQDCNGFRVVRNAEGPAPAAPVTHTVTFDSTTTWPGSTLSIAPVQVYDGKKVAQPSETPTDTVHFRGWFTKPNPTTSDTAFDFSTTTITRDMTLYAVYDFVYVEGTTFEGNETLCKDVTNKESKVFIKDRVIPIGNLWVCDHEVTQGEYQTYCKYGYGSGGSDQNFPAYYVNWYDALVYCNLRSINEGLTPVYKIQKANGELTDNPAEWVNIVSDGSGASLRYYGPASTDTETDVVWNKALCDWNANGYRLPTEAEWEYIARGGSLLEEQYIYSGSNECGNVAWYSGNSGNTENHVVKGKNANSLGIYDMSGNVFEWCWDWYIATIPAATDPYGVLSGARRVKRGGSRANVADDCSIATSRNDTNTTDRNNCYGFRVVRTAGNSDPSVPVRHTVTFDTTTNWPGSSLTIEPVKVTAGKKIKQPSQTPNDPVHFRGWFTKANPSATDTPFNFNTTAIKRDLTLYAVWDFVYVEGGTVVGNDDYNPRRADGETYIGAFPAGRTVTLSSFYISDHELTQGEYETYCSYTSSTPSSSYGEGADYPAYYVSWYDAIVYCNLRSMAENLTPCYALGGETDPTKWDGIKSINGKYSCNHTSSNSTWNSITCDITASGYRLPTEAEWEYAARGGQETYGTTAFANYFAGATTTNYSTSSNSDLDSVGWYLYNICNNGVTGSEGSSGAAGYGTHEVKKKAPNALGLYDMSGNVYEWCWDWKDSISTSETVTNPRGASSGSNRVGRGGSWGNLAIYCSVSIRRGDYPDGRSYYYGFRLVRSAQ